MSMSFDSLLSKYRLLCNQPIQYTPPTDGDVIVCESDLAIKFPRNYVRLLQETASAKIRFWDLLRIFQQSPPPGDPFDIVHVNRFNRKRGLPTHLIAFWSAGNGDFDCFDTSARTAESEWAVVSWSHDADPEDGVLSLHASFADWLDDQIQDRQPVE